MWETTNGKPPEPIIMIWHFSSETGSSSLITFITLLSVLQCHYQSYETLQKWWAKTTLLSQTSMFDLFSSNFNVQGHILSRRDTLMSSLIHVMSNGKVPKSIWAQNIPGIKIIMTLHEILGHPVLSVSFIQHYIQKWLILYSWSLYITETIIGASPQSIHSPKKQEHYFLCFASLHLLESLYYFKSHFSNSN
jgi:hypothetical protein